MKCQADTAKHEKPYLPTHCERSQLPVFSRCLPDFVLDFRRRFWYNIRCLRHQESLHGKVSCARRAEHHVGGNPQGLDAIRVRVDENKRFQRQGLPVSNEMDSSLFVKAQTIRDVLFNPPAKPEKEGEQK